MDDLIERLASFVFRRVENRERPYTLLLGAGASLSSGCPDWWSLCKAVCDEMGVSIPDGSDPITALKDNLFTNHIASRERYLSIQPHLANHQPSLGYRHLSQLIAQGYFAVIITTNWDSLLEEALARLVKPDTYKVLVRGEVPDNVIADYLQREIPRVKILKIHGDLVTRLLMVRDEDTFALSDELTTQLGELFDEDGVVVGHSLRDIDILRPLLSRKGKGTVYYVSPHDQKGDLQSLLAKVKGMRYISGADGEFDRFFVRLNLAIQRQRSRSLLAERLRTESSILEKQERGRGYINYNTISEMVEQFARKILSKKPSILFFINDPTAPGGMELKKRMERHLGAIPTAVIEISGEGKNRVYKRRVKGGGNTTPDPTFQNIFVLDSITFSGNTLNIARAKIQKWYPHAVVQAGVLLISQHLLDRLTATHPLHGVIYQAVTDRHEIFFPWGVTQTTGNFARVFTGLDDKRIVEILKRPWGTVEILADEEVCSVRLLTIEADERLSFQRHLCRDELFVALDDNIGLDVCGDDPEAPFSIFDPKIKSLILETGDYILIPRGIWHRTKASKYRVRLLEVAFGVYDQSNDIERLDDTFGRVGIDGSH